MKPLPFQSCSEEEKLSVRDEGGLSTAVDIWQKTKLTVVKKFANSYDDRGQLLLSPSGLMRSNGAV